MFCPNCGTKNSINQNFCRSCGLGLEKAAQSLVEQLPAKRDEKLEEQTTSIERLGVFALSGFGVVGLGVLIYLTIFKMILAEGRVLAGIAFLTLIICGILAVVFFNYANTLREAGIKRRFEQPTELGSEEVAGKLLNESYLEPVPSVTERTTELLYVEKKGNDKKS